MVDLFSENKDYSISGRENKLTEVLNFNYFYESFYSFYLYILCPYTKIITILGLRLKYNEIVPLVEKYNKIIFL